MKKSILCIVLALCLCLCMMLVACNGEDPAEDPTPDNQPPVEDPTPDESETPAEEDGDVKGQFHPTPNAGGADVNVNEPNEQLPDSTLRG